MKTVAISTGISTAKSSAKISSAKQLNSEIKFKDIFSKTENWNEISVLTVWVLKKNEKVQA